jgi:ribokinase
VLVTLGPDGALLLDDTAERLRAPAVDVVDTTGAGDAVNGALAAELAAGRPLRDAVRFALAAAALSTRAAGARAGMPRRLEVQ